MTNAPHETIYLFTVKYIYVRTFQIENMTRIQFNFLLLI